MRRFIDKVYYSDAYFSDGCRSRHLDAIVLAVMPNRRSAINLPINENQVYFTGQYAPHYNGDITMQLFNIICGYKFYFKICNWSNINYFICFTKMCNL